MKDSTLQKRRRFHSHTSWNTVLDITYLHAKVCWSIEQQHECLGRPRQVSTSARTPLRREAALEAADAIGRVPYDRWDLENRRLGSSQPRMCFGGWLQHFDAAMFGISVPEAELMDPQQRLLLEVHPMWLSYSSACAYCMQLRHALHPLMMITTHVRQGHVTLHGMIEWDDAEPHSHT